MYLIAICDDELEEISKTDKILGDYKTEHLMKGYPETDFETLSFTDADALIDNVREGKYMPDLIFMDIYMQSKTGIEAARELRDMGVESRIVFLTTSREYALDAFRVDAIQYLVKPVMKADMYGLLDRIFADTAARKNRYVLVQAEKKVCRIMVQDIIYCEAQKKSQHMFLADGSELCLHMSMVGLEELLSEYSEIVRVGKSYIVNLRHVESLNGLELQMDNGETLYMPRGVCQFLREQYFGYYTEGLS